MTTSFEPAIPAGTLVYGKWNKSRYLVERLLGEGANGKVYLVRRGKELFALKTGFDPMDHQSEVNALKVLSKSSTSFKQFLIDSDDFEWKGIDYPFSVMRYIRGKSLNEYFEANGYDWLHLIGSNLLHKLAEVHASGFVFGDLKAENMIITGYGDVELIDFGGVTPKGRSVKQFTEVYDRGYWGSGFRTADEAYDLFSFAVLMLNMTDRGRKFHKVSSILPQNRNVDMLLDMLNANPLLEPVAPVIRQALLGHYAATDEALSDWRRCRFSKHVHGHAPALGHWIKLCFAASLILFGASVYFIWN